MIGGQVHGTGTHTGSIRVFECKDGFQLVGDTVSVCTKPASWSHVAPNCTATTTTTAATSRSAETVTCKLSSKVNIYSVLGDGKPIDIARQCTTKYVVAYMLLDECTHHCSYTQQHALRLLACFLCSCVARVHVFGVWIHMHA